MKSVLLGIGIAAVFTLILAFPPAHAANAEWYGLAQAKPATEGQFADLAGTRAQDEPVQEYMVLVCREDNETTLCVDGWAMSALDPDAPQTAKDGIREKDFEAELTFKDAKFRVKLAVYELVGDEIYSVRFAKDFTLSAACTATLSAELMQGAFDLGVAKVSGSCVRTVGKWNLSADLGLAYNTLNNQPVGTLGAQALYGDKVAVGGWLKGYASERSNDIAIGGITRVKFTLLK